MIMDGGQSLTNDDYDDYITDVKNELDYKNELNYAWLINFFKSY